MMDMDRESLTHHMMNMREGFECVNDDNDYEYDDADYEDEEIDENFKRNN